MLGFGGLAAGVCGIALLTWWNDTGMGGEPFAVARIERLPSPPAAPPAVVPTAELTGGADTTGAIRAPLAARATASEVEMQSGVRVVRQGGGGPPGALVIQVPDDFGVHLTAAPDKRLVEKGRFGPLPRIGVDGSRPAEVYARPVITSTSLRTSAPRIALVVGGMGLSQQATQGASGKLPGAVTLAFAPYGVDLDKQAARVRENGHETILQMPMEPFDASQSPGPHMLQAAAPAEENIEHLHWLMSRMQGYTGVAGFLGAKFLANPAALAPILRETASRGLFYLDDGSIGASASGAVAASSGVAMLRTDIVLDASPKPEAIDAELGRLEKLARQKGSAIGMATGLPATVEQIARFARGLEKRGIALVPLSSLAAGPPAPTAGIR